MTQAQHQQEESSIMIDSTSSINNDNAMLYPSELHLLRRVSTTSTSSLFSSKRDDSVISVRENESQYLRRQSILHKGYLLTKKRFLSGYNRRYYFVLRDSPDLFVFKDKDAYEQWMSREQSDEEEQQPRSTSRRTRISRPSLLFKILRADLMGDATLNDYAIAIMGGKQSGNNSKVTHRVFIAETPDIRNAWMKAFQTVQLKSHDPIQSEAKQINNHEIEEETLLNRQRNNSTMSLASASAVSLESMDGEAFVLRSRPSDANLLSQQTSSNAKALKQLQQVSPQMHRASQMDSTLVIPPPSSSNGSNVVLFVPANGSSVAISDTKLASAKKELEDLIAKGSKVPERKSLEMETPVQWRYGTPNYTLSDLAYAKGQTRGHDTTPLESYIENCLQTFVMEATHKADYSQWTSVLNENFYLQVNDGPKLHGRDFRENDMFGLLYLREKRANFGLDVAEKKRHPGAILAEAFSEGFPFEVLEVYTQPPTCFFSWRHWGHFNGVFNGSRGNGEVVELKGFGQIAIENGKIVNLKMYYKERNLTEALHQISASLPSAFPIATTVTSASPTRTSRSRASSCTYQRSRSNSEFEKKPRVYSTDELFENLATFTTASIQQNQTPP